MSIPLYMDVHIPAAVSEGLQIRGVDVLTAQADGRRLLFDPLLLDRATALRRALVTQDSDFLIEAARRQTLDVPFSGVFYAHQLRITIGQFIDDLELICLVEDLEYMQNRVEWLPLNA